MVKPKSKKGKGKGPKERKERRKVPCPLLACKSQVTHLPRHMRNVHKWTEEASRKVLSKYNIRKRKSPKKSPKKKDYHRRRRCPVSQCQSIVFRLTQHLKKVHKMKRSSTEFRDALENARVVPDIKHPLLRKKDERAKKRSVLLTDWNRPSTSAAYHEGDSSDKINEQAKKTSVLMTDWNRPSTSAAYHEDDSSDDKISDCPARRSDESTNEQIAKNPVILKFEEWMLSPDGGKRDAKTAKQHSSQVFGMLKAIDDEEDMHSLLDLALVRNVFLKSHVVTKKYEVGTIKSYLMSLRHFFSFLLSDKPDEVDFDAHDIKAAREKVQLWSTSYRKESSVRKWQKLEEDFQNRLTAANITKFEKSEAARNAIKELGKHSDVEEKTVVTQSSYTLVRDFLFTQIFTDNANRPGALAGMTMNEYRQMRKEGDDYVISVMDHKTAHVYGPAIIVLSKKLMSWLSVFVEVMRAEVTTTKTGHVFLTWNGQRMTSGQINRAVQSVFKKAEIDQKVTCTSFRKAAVTKVHTEDPELSGKLAGLMAHRETTAKKYYLLADKSKASVEASKKLGKLMRADDIGNKDESDRSEGKDKTSVKKLAGLDPEGETESLERNKGEGKAKGTWTDSDLTKVQQVFQEEIKNKTITLAMVRDRVEENEDLHGMSPRRIYDRLRRDLKKTADVLDATCQLPKACESLQDKLLRMCSSSASVSGKQETTTCDDGSSASIVPPSERNSNFTNLQLETVHKIFGDMITKGKKVSKVEIQNRCDENRDAKQLLDKISIVQLLNRIKYERRKKLLTTGIAKKGK